MTGLVTMLTVVGTVVGILTWMEVTPFKDDPPPGPTTKIIYMPKKVPSATEDFGALCAQTSQVSRRSDARTCVWLHMLLDPCFTVSDDVVACPRLNVVDADEPHMKDAYYPVEATREFAFDPLLHEHTMSADVASHDSAPWMIELAARRDDGYPVTCQLVHLKDFSSVPTDTGIYRCSSPAPLFVSDVQGFITGTNLEVFTAESPDRGRVLAFGLNIRDGATWTVQYTPAGASEAVETAIVRAWY